MWLRRNVEVLDSFPALSSGEMVMMTFDQALERAIEKTGRCDDAAASASVSLRSMLIGGKTTDRTRHDATRQDSTRT